jgi:antitoxin Xre/MbcA/ParS-like protein
MMNRDNPKLQRTSLEIEGKRTMSTTARTQSDLLPGENPDIRVDVHRLLQNADEWLETPNSNFGGRAPIELIGTNEEFLVRETLRSAVYSGMA